MSKTTCVGRSLAAAAAIGVAASLVGAEIAPARDTASSSVVLRAFTAKRLKKDCAEFPTLCRRIVLRWQTGAEPNTLGFHVYRERAGKKVRVTKTMISAKQAATGASYSYTDRLPKGVKPASVKRYSLQVVQLDAKRTWLDSTNVR